MFEQKVAVITGAASGIGLGIVRCLVTQGIRQIVLVDIDGEALGELATELKGQSVDVLSFTRDVFTNAKTPEEFSERAKDIVEKGVSLK